MIRSFPLNTQPPQVHFSGCCFEKPCSIHNWRNPAEREMWTDGIAESFDMGKSRRLRRSAGREIHQMYGLTLRQPGAGEFLHLSQG